MPNQRQTTQQAKFTSSSFEKKKKKIESQGKNQIKAIEDHGKQFIESDELMKKNFNIDRDSILLEEQKIIFNEPAEEISSEFKNLEKKN